MPLYEYLCTACEHRFDRRGSFETAGEPETCPECGGSAKKLLSHFSAFMRTGGNTVSGIKGASGWTGPSPGPDA